MTHDDLIGSGVTLTAPALEHCIRHLLGVCKRIHICKLLGHISCHIGIFGFHNGRRENLAVDNVRRINLGVEGVIKQEADTDVAGSIVHVYNCVTDAYISGKITVFYLGDDNILRNEITLNAPRNAHQSAAI